MSHRYSLVRIHLNILMSYLELKLRISDDLILITSYSSLLPKTPPECNSRHPHSAACLAVHHTGVLGNLYGSVSGQTGCLESRNCGSGFSCGKNRQGESSWPVVVHLKPVRPNCVNINNHEYYKSQHPHQEHNNRNRPLKIHTVISNSLNISRQGKQSLS